MSAVIAAIVALAPLVEKYGPPFVNALIALFQKSGDPTAAEWAALLQSTQTTARQQMLTVLQAHGIDPASPQGVALLALTPS